MPATPYQIRNTQKEYSYRQSRGGFASDNDVTQIRRVKPLTRKIENTTPQVEPSGSAPTMDENFNASYGERGLVGAFKEREEEKDDKRSYGTENNYYIQRPKNRRLRKPARLNKLKLTKDSAAKAAELRARKRALKVNIRILSFNIPFWLSWQLPFAIFNAIFFGLATAVDKIQQTILSADDSGEVSIFGHIVNVIDKTLDQIVKSIDYVTYNLFEFKLGELISNTLNPATYFMLTLTILVTFTLLQIFLIYLVYKVNRLEPIFGKGSGMKLGAIILTLIGSTIPILNMFPWFIFWTIAVWRNPK